jgi:3-carboxy-cis,cis-muconate cycloisomerase
MLDAEAALTRAHHVTGPAPAAAVHAVDAAARAEHYDVRSLALRARGGGNPVIPLVSDLADRVGPEHAAWVHRGATSQDILDSAMMLVALRARRLIAADLDRSLTALRRLADAHRTTAMAGRTLTQHAAPTTFGLKAAGWRQLVRDAQRRLTALPLPAQLGGSAGTLAAFGDHALPLAARYAEEAGLDEPPLPWHVLRTPVAELGTALALVGGALGKVAADILVLGRTEIGEVAEGTGGVSSAMPHKANPVLATLVAAAARQLPQHAATLLAAMAAEDERPAGAWHSEWHAVREALRLAGGASRDAAELLENLRVDGTRMRENLGLTGGRILSEGFADRYEPLLGRREARRAVTGVLASHPGPGGSLADLLARDPRTAGLVDAAELRALDDPAAHLGSAAALVERALARQDDADRPHDGGEGP